MQTWEIIPSPQDILWMVGKEAFEPEQVEMFGLDEEFPTEVAPWLTKQGLSSYWQHRYWRAHWTAPSIQMGFEMLHRGEIDENQLDLLFKVQEIPAFWRDRLRAISYKPYTRVDIRRMYALGVVDLEAVYRNFRDLGYDHEKATNSTEFVRRYAQSEPKRLSRTQVEEAYEEGIITRSEAVALIEDAGYSEDQAEYLIRLAEYDQQSRARKRRTAVLKDRFIKNLIQVGQLRSDLLSLDYGERKVDLLIEEFEADKELHQKLPSKTDLDKMVKAGVIGKELWERHMQMLGYDPGLRQLYWELIEKDVPSDRLSGEAT
jgi:hypothetical protein